MRFIYTSSKGRKCLCKTPVLKLADSEANPFTNIRVNGKLSYIKTVLSNFLHYLKYETKNTKTVSQYLLYAVRLRICLLSLPMLLYPIPVNPVCFMLN